MSMLPADAHRRLHQSTDAIDAARYRWLRENAAYSILCELRPFPDGWKAGLPYGQANWPAGLDAAVDGHRLGDAMHANPVVPNGRGGSIVVAGRQGGQP